jgi:hypothetical protein
MGYRDAVRDATADARRDVLEAALVLGAHLDAAEGDVDDETIVRALSAFMDARTRYLAALGAQYGVTRDSGPPSTDSQHSVRELGRRFGLSA